MASTSPLSWAGILCYQFWWWWGLGFPKFIFPLLLFFYLIVLLFEIITGFIAIYCNLKSTVILLNNKSRRFSQKYSDVMVAFELT